MTSDLLHRLLERAAKTSPEHPALIDGDLTLSYRELDERSNALAERLSAIGLAKGDRVGLYLDKSADAVIALYAAMKAGGAYVPLDPNSPPARLASILQDCAVRVLITHTSKADDVPALIGGTTKEPAVVFADEIRDERARAAPAVDVTDEDLAYILYTSGSTGAPKGVMLTHRNALGFVEWAARRFKIGPADRVSSHAPFHFDLSIFDLFAAAAGGATLVLVPPQTSFFPSTLKNFIEESGITVWYSVPSVLTFLTLRGGLTVGDLPRLRTILFAGEVFPTRHLRAVMELVPHAGFFNLYGPTETNVCTYYEVSEPPSGDDDIPIGRPIDTDEVLILGDDGAPVADRQPGELWVRGQTVMQGYWGDAEKTASVLRTSPYGDPMYRTGDLVRMDENGDIRFLGRKDGQIKSRGYRIELGEVETAINSHPLVVECAAVAVPDDLATNLIRAYVVAKDDLAPEELKRHCLARIPSYMVPETFVFTDALPKTSTGKTDRQRLVQD